MLLVSYLRSVNHQDRGLTSYERSRLKPDDQGLVELSRDWVYLRSSATCALRRLARRADMDQFSICCN